ncbi:hypothetical protein Tco_1365479, partial [Tanacetum coccineum]
MCFTHLVSMYSVSALRTQYRGNALSQYSTTSTQSICALRTQYCGKALSQYSTTSTQSICDLCTQSIMHSVCKMRPSYVLVG